MAGDEGWFRDWGLRDLGSNPCSAPDFLWDLGKVLYFPQALVSCMCNAEHVPPSQGSSEAKAPGMLEQYLGWGEVLFSPTLLQALFPPRPPPAVL